MLKSFLVAVAFILTAQAQASSCPDPISFLGSVKIEGNMTVSQDLTETCQESVQMALECKQDGSDDYNHKMALAARVQCEYDLIRLRANSSVQPQKFRSAFSRYQDLKYSCRKLAKSEAAKEYCQAESAKLVLTYFKDAK